MRLSPLFVIILLLNSYSIKGEQNEPDENFINGLINKLIDSLKKFFTDLISAPVQSLLVLINELLKLPINVVVFKDFWQDIIYLANILFGLILLYCANNIIINSFNPAKREKSKSMIKKAIVMAILVNSSYLIYDFIMDFSNSLTDYSLSLVDHNIFDISNNSYDIITSIIFIVTGIFTVLILGIRYFLASIGLILFPIAIALYYLNFTKNYGRILINLIFAAMFLPFFYSIILVGTSKLIETQFFSSHSVLALSISFGLISLIVVLVLASFFINSLNEISINKYLNVL